MDSFWFSPTDFFYEALNQSLISIKFPKKIPLIQHAMSSNGKSALSGDSSSEKPKGVQAESYSGPINPIDTPCVSSSHSIGDPYSKQAKVVVSVSSGLTKLCVPDSKKPLLFLYEIM